jgi:hypothetical protein
MRILTDEEINKIYDRWLHEPKEPKFTNWTTYLTTETARLVREETLKEVGKWLDKQVFITPDQIAKLSQGVMPC